MKIIVVGAGAMGSLFGGHLSRAGHDVTLVTPWEDHVRKIQDTGLFITGAGEEVRVWPKALTQVPKEGPFDLLLVFVKAYRTQVAIRAARHLVSERTAVLTLQNGLGNVDILLEELGGRGGVLGGTTAQGAKVEEPGHIFRGGTGPTHIAPVKDGEVGRQRAAEVAQILSSAGFPTDAQDDPVPLIWRKVAVNVLINPLTALLGIPNGKLVECSDLFPVMDAIVHETSAVARAEGIILPDDLREKAFEVASRTAVNRSSMLQDLDRRRPTEILSLNGAVAEKGRSHGLSSPVNETMTSLIVAKERSLGIER